jgi:hypothetical protein
MTEAAVSFAGNLTDDSELRHTESGIARDMFRVAVSGRREQEASFFIHPAGRGRCPTVPVGPWEIGLGQVGSRYRALTAPGPAHR